jgi:hypothetical protein
MKMMVMMMMRRKNRRSRIKIRNSIETKATIARRQLGK